MRTLKLTLEYDGTDFSGWQFQNNGRSVQGEIERAATTLLRSDIRITGAGRTDSGVHARGQVCHFQTAHDMECEPILRGLNGLLPPDIVIHRVENAPDDFHARYSAKLRIYRYYISKTPQAILRRYRWFVPFRLDLNAMRDCAAMTLGEHDFSSFCKVDPDADHRRCTVSFAQWTENGDDYVFEIGANRFLHGMVRALVGTMVDVGRGFRTWQDFSRIMNAKNRSEAGQSAPALGLFLEEVKYAP